MTPLDSSRSRRLQMLGTASLSALLIGGLILILVGVNALSNYDPKSSRGYDRNITPAFMMSMYMKSIVSGQVAFKIGITWSLQTWIAITGVAFGLLSFGFAETYMHIFDHWCSRQAQRGSGLDYARYLNSQARAPVLYGLRGFPAFVTLRYIIISMGVATSVGYKFAFITPDVWVAENLLRDTVRFLPHRMSMITNDTSFSEPEPWISDFPLEDISRSFSHIYQRERLRQGKVEYDGGANTTLPPSMLVMAGHASCLHGNASDPPFSHKDFGRMATRELALTANSSIAEGTFTMTEDKGDWQRIEVPNSRFFYPPQKAIIEYRVPKFAELQIQWAKAPSNSSGTWEVPVVNRTRYVMDAGVFLVYRYVEAQNCMTIAGRGGSGMHRRAFNNDTFENFLRKRGVITKEEIGRDYVNITEKMPEYSVWLEALIKTQDTTLLTAVSAIIRVVMAAYKMDLLPTGYIEDDDMPFEEEFEVYGAKYTGENRLTYEGTRVGRYSGCYIAAAVVFVILGCFAILVTIFRVWLGPPVLTSWMGQHAYLARTEAISLSQEVSGLASGYQVARRDLGRLRLPIQKGEETGAMLKHDNSTDSEGRSTKEHVDSGEVNGVRPHGDSTRLME
ncbi:hypothetical protein FVEN_g1581 [Fusarium venenatum]|uniref:Uncharacterized protein n=1 Tax=Fusarium venenatum TaxID=56646 RepID=A0A2L2SWZ5_9HYPO|nr:uncharacterized protein FVRRES_13196 [Fusarium venenatum]KAG8360852.1 hypothetical protein FVEN_g1581 [Fusarium venenatum]KAH6979756.1 hypothetical protein EDB82DRAFT_268826 [Fusarium venenatum]CEI40617.1 unnamed protein product [Fusarium venenatum]